MASFGKAPRARRRRRFPYEAPGVQGMRRSIPRRQIPGAPYRSSRPRALSGAMTLSPGVKAAAWMRSGAPGCSSSQMRRSEATPRAALKWIASPISGGAQTARLLARFARDAPPALDAFFAPSSRPRSLRAASTGTMRADAEFGGFLDRPFEALEFNQRKVERHRGSCGAGFEFLENANSTSSCAPLQPRRARPGACR